MRDQEERSALARILRIESGKGRREQECYVMLQVITKSVYESRLDLLN